MDIRSCSRPGYSPGLLIFNSILQILYDVKQLGWTLDFYWNFGGKKVRPILEYTIVQQCINNIYLFSISVKRKILPQCYITQKIIKVKKKKKMCFISQKNISAFSCSDINDPLEHRAEISIRQFDNPKKKAT